MSPDAGDVRQWLKKAAHDREVAELAVKNVPAITDVAAFHTQQAVEKLLKGYLVFHEIEFEKIHDLEILLSHCAEQDPAFLGLLDRVEPLTSYAVRFRYPGPGDPTVEQVASALRVVTEVETFVLDRLPPEVRP